MKRLIGFVGKVSFWLSWPVQAVVLRIGRRTRVVIAVDGKVLMIKGLISTGIWSLPGGGLHKGEDPVRGAIREVREETGVELQPQQLVKLYDGVSEAHHIPFKYTCYKVELAERPVVKNRLGEIAEHAWLDPSQITLDNTSPNAYKAVQSWLKS